MIKVVVNFGNITKSKNDGFEEWLSTNGYFYMKTVENRPCFKSKLTQKLNKKFQAEKCQSNPSKSNIFSFKCR